MLGFAMSIFLTEYLIYLLHLFSSIEVLFDNSGWERGGGRGWGVTAQVGRVKDLCVTAKFPRGELLQKPVHV